MSNKHFSEGKKACQQNEGDYPDNSLADTYAFEYAPAWGESKARSALMNYIRGYREELLIRLRTDIKELDAILVDFEKNLIDAKVEKADPSLKEY